MHDVILSIEGLRKSFGALTATDGVNLDLRMGEIHAPTGRTAPPATAIAC